MRAYKFLTADGLGLFSRFPWPLPDGGPGEWVDSEVEPCRFGIHGCRARDLPYWAAPELYELELDGPIDELELKVVAPRGRLLRRVDAWDGSARDDYGRMCIARASELVASAPSLLSDWAPTGISPAESARLGYIVARISEELGGSQAHREERRLQSAWLVERLSLA